MAIRITAVLLIAGVLAGCKSVEGLYLPGCAAYAGDRIELHGSDFTWDKFTDEVHVDDDGNALDPFPDYPRQGVYELDGQLLRMTFNDNNSSETMHLHEHDGHILLLTDAQHSAWESTGRMDDCALTRAEQQ